MHFFPSERVPLENHPTTSHGVPYKGKWRNRKKVWIIQDNPTMTTNGYCSRHAPWSPYWRILNRRLYPLLIKTLLKLYNLIQGLKPF
jgi:hypothetical protein